MRRVALWGVLVLSLATPASAGAAIWSVDDTTDTPVGQPCAGSTGCSLREAVTSAEANPGGDIIEVAGGTYPLSNGELSVSQPLVVRAAGAAPVVIDGLDSARIFNLTAGTLELERMTLRNARVDVPAGPANGGAILAAPGTTLTLTGSTIETSEAIGFNGARGGAIHSAGSVVVRSHPSRDSLITQNRAETANQTAQGGGISIEGNQPLQILSGTEVSENTAVGPGGWGGGVFSQADVAVEGAAINGNSAFGGAPLGGGIYATSANLTVSGSEIDDNHLSAPGTTAGTGPSGGGLALEGGVLSVTDSAITRNDAIAGGATSVGIGGGVYVLPGDPTDIAEISRTTIDGNSVTAGHAYGGGIGFRAGPLSVTRSTLSDNEAAGTGANLTTGGGAIGVAEHAFLQGTIETELSTLAGNRATVTGTPGAVAAGGAVFNPAGGSEVRTTTVAGNSVSAAAGSTAQGGAISGNSNPDAFTLGGSIVAENTAPGGAQCAQGTVTSEGFGVLGPLGACAGGPVASDATGVADAGIGPLAANGGPTETMAVEAGSPALDRIPILEIPGPVALCSVVGTDQRGVARPQGPRCESGAYEVIVPPDPDPPPAPPGEPSQPPANPPPADPPPPPGPGFDPFACDERRLAIQFLERKGRKALVEGLAASSLIGSTVELLVGSKVASKTEVEPDGSFAGLVKLPRSEADVRRVRVLARIGEDVSRNVKLTRRARIVEALSTGGTTTLVGKVLTREAAKPPKLTVRRRVACEGESQWIAVASGKQKRDGSFRVSFDNPPGAVGSIFDVQTKYAKKAGERAKHSTATQAVAIAFG